MSGWRYFLVFNENHFKIVNVSLLPWQLLFSIHFTTVWISHFRPRLETWNLHELRNPSQGTQCLLLLLLELRYCSCFKWGLIWKVGIVLPYNSKITLMDYWLYTQASSKSLPVDFPSLGKLMEISFWMKNAFKNLKPLVCLRKWSAATSRMQRL